ncbi:UDP-N-acetylglucosamine 2-epimerase (non-hydrolyzing) [bacterium]|nr:UDP-N-acetylglucosamine 2-epimerase (non-hydrolyzing) [bacterium]MBU1025735.1 UDP-N-acetylglucosamine 2-epimerase (non-hydrolyzing) [bacterium]
MTPPKILCTFGTRPDAVKMAPLVKQLQADGKMNCVVAVTAQHRQMLDQILEIFQLTPDYDMNIMRDRQSLEDIATAILREFPLILEKEKPDIVLVHGDTSTAFLSALVCFYRSIPVGHVEAGLRTSDPFIPYPEEMNRRLIDQIASLLLAPTRSAKNSLLMERHSPQSIYVTGNTVVDALLTVSKLAEKVPLPDYIENLKENRIILVTAHRRESWDDGLKRISVALREIVETVKDAAVLFPIHKNPRVREEMEPIIGNHPRITLIEPLDYLAFVQAMIHSYLILTDSGGIQEEAPSLNIPVLVMRDLTERSEGVHAGCVGVVGTYTDSIVENTLELLTDSVKYNNMANSPNPFGDGLASDRIVKILKNYFGISKAPLEEF